MRSPATHSNTFLQIQSFVFFNLFFFFLLLISPNTTSYCVIASHSAWRCGSAGVSYWGGCGTNAGRPGASPTSQGPRGSRAPSRTLAARPRWSPWWRGGCGCSPLVVVGGIASLWGQDEEEEVVVEMKRDLGAYSLKSGTSRGEDEGDVSLTSGGEKKSRDAIWISRYSLRIRYTVSKCP